MTEEEDKTKEKTAAEKKAEEEQKKIDAEILKKAKEHPDDKIARANEAAERQEAANKEHAELLDRQERLAIDAKLGGESAAGSAPVEPKEETPGDYAKKVMAGDENE